MKKKKLARSITAEITEKRRRIMICKKSKCPFCLGDNVDYGPINIERAMAVRQADCMDCNEEFHEFYSMVEVFRIVK